MRNLKRALSLALAAVMVLGMMVMGASAASINDFADKDEIKNQEAVALMVNLGILEGYAGANGQEFGPKATLQRNAMAKIAYMVATGATDWDMYKLGTPTYKDIDNDWAEGAIEYCANLGYIQGANGYFFPNDTLTVAATATILLRTLGFDNEKQGYGGDQWMINAMRDAKDYGLLNGVSNTVASSPISRDDACQMAYNALFTNVRVPDVDRDMGEYYVKGYEVKPYTLGMSSYNLVKLTATVTDANTLTASNKIGDATVTGADNFVKAENLTIAPDMVGSNVTVYAKATYTTDPTTGKINAYTVTGLWSDSLVKAASNAKYTLTGPYKTKAGADAVAQLGTDKVLTMADDVTYYVNGAVESSADTYNGLIGKRGVVVEFKCNNNADGKIDTVVITNKTVATLGNITTKGTGDKMTVTINDTDISNVPVANVPGYETLKKGDVVLYVKVGNTYTIEKAASVEGIVSGIKTVGSEQQLNVNGTYYSASGITGAKLDEYSLDSSDFKNTYTFYLDDYNNIVASKKVTEETVTKYAVALAYGIIPGSGIGGTSVYQVQLLFEDATVDIVNMATFGGKTIVGDATSETAGDGEVAYKTVNAEANIGKFVEYSINKDGKYELTLVEKTTTVAEAEIKTNTALFDGTNVANANTVFLTYNNATKKYEVSKGIANVPGILSDANKGGSMIKGDDGIATLVYIVADAFKGDEVAGQTAYILDKDTFEVSADGYKYDAIVNGAKTTLTSKTALEVEGLITYTTVDGLITKPTEITGKTGIVTVSGGVLVVGDGGEENTYLYNDETVVYVIDEGEVSTISADNISVDDNDEITVQTVPGSTNNTAAVIYILKVAAVD